MSYIGPLTKEIIDTCIKELKKKETKLKINKYLIDPILKEVMFKTYPYALSHVFFQIIIIAMLIYIIFLLKTKYNN